MPLNTFSFEPETIESESWIRHTCICTRDTYMDMYTCTCSPFLGSHGSILFNSVSLIGIHTCLMSILFSPWTSFFYLDMSHYFYILALSAFLGVLSPASFVLTEQSIFHLVCSFHLLPFPRHFSFLVFFNTGYFFSQLILLLLTLQLIWKPCGLDFFSLPFHLQTYI